MKVNHFFLVISYKNLQYNQSRLIALETKVRLKRQRFIVEYPL